MKKSVPLLVALVDASCEQPPFYLGRLISLHPTEVEGRIAELDWTGTQIQARTRIVNLKRPLAVGSLIDSRSDLAPLTGIEVSKRSES
jgi:hypothetical protein